MRGARQLLRRPGRAVPAPGRLGRRRCATTSCSTTGVGDGELLHVYTPVLGTGFYVELLERRGGYDGYGSANTHVRLASQDAPTTGGRPRVGPRVDAV